MRTTLRHVLAVLAFTGLTACKVLENPWWWLDVPADQYWVPVKVVTYGRTIEFAIPDNAENLGEKVVWKPKVPGGSAQHRIVVPLDNFEQINQEIVSFFWEVEWLGVGKGYLANLDLSIALHFRSHHSELLDQTAEDRVTLVREDYKSYFPSESSWQKVEPYLIVEPFEASNGNVWVKRNAPTVTKEQELFFLPVSDKHEISFWFFYRMDDDPPSNSQAWLERRKQLARQILGTVNFDPPVESDPFRARTEPSG